MLADPLWQLDAISLDPARLREVTLTIGRGVTAVIGWSGAGKTSLLNVLAGFEKPDRGRMNFPRANNRGSPWRGRSRRRRGCWSWMNRWCMSIRRARRSTGEWEHSESAVSLEEVAAVRAATKSRTKPWTAEELQKPFKLQTTKAK